MMDEIKTGKQAATLIMAGLFKAIQENRGFREPEIEKDPWAWIPERYRGSTFENYNTYGIPEKTEALRQIREGVQTESQIWTGNYGTGKTHLAYACVKEYGAKFENFSVLLSQIKDDWEGEVYIIRDHIKPKILILDEIGMIELTEWRKDILFRIIDGRYAARKNTILITNQTIRDFGKYLGIGIVDRLRPRVIEFMWESERGRYK